MVYLKCPTCLCICADVGKAIAKYGAERDGVGGTVELGAELGLMGAGSETRLVYERAVWGIFKNIFVLTKVDVVYRHRPLRFFARNKDRLQTLVESEVRLVRNFVLRKCRDS